MRRSEHRRPTGAPALRLGALTLTLALAAGAWNPAHAGPGHDEEPAGEGGHDGDHAAAERHEWMVTMEAGHVHVFSEADITFRVHDMDHCEAPGEAMTCEGVSALEVVAFRRSEHGGVSEQPLDGQALRDNGDGSYTWTTSFGDLTGYTVGLRVLSEGHEYFGAFPLEPSKAGGERFFCDVDDDGAEDRGYQIRWHASDGHLHADGEDVAFYVELKRSIDATVNVDEPWTNRFDHLRPEELDGGAPVVELMHGHGDAAEVAATLESTYRGKGVYTVQHAFTEDAVGHDGGEFWLRVGFTDDLGCAVHGASDAEAFEFHVSAGH